MNLKTFVANATILVAALLICGCVGSGGDYDDAVNDLAGASDAEVNACSEIAQVAEYAMRNRQRGVLLATQIEAARESGSNATQSAAMEAAVRNVYSLPMGTSPSDAWGITQTACLHAMNGG